MEHKRQFRDQFRDLPDEVKQKINASTKGKPKSYDHRQHISQGMRQYWQSVPPQNCPIPMTDMKSYQTMLVLKDCDFDLEKVESKVRTFCRSKGTSIKKMMEPYRAMMEQMAGQNGQYDMTGWEEVR